jgi:hypothetical protein
MLTAALASALAGGCQSINPPVTFDLPVITPLGGTKITEQNPVYIPGADQEKEYYGRVFEAALQTLSDFNFEFGPGDANRYGGRIDAVPRTAPGILLFCRQGSPDPYERLLCSLQSYRYRVTILLQPANQGGFFVEFIVRKELEDVPRPIASTVGGAVFRSENTAERQTEVIDATFFQSKWIYKGRDVYYEQEMIRRLKEILNSCPACVPTTMVP